MFEARLKQLRENKGLSQYAFANKLGLSQSAVGNWESGKRIPDAEMLCAIADYFEVSVDYLLGRSDNKNPEIFISNLMDQISYYKFHNLASSLNLNFSPPLLYAFDNLNPEHQKTISHMIEFFQDIEHKQK